MRIAIAALFAATLVAPIHQADAQAPEPAAGVPARCWVDLPNGGEMVIPNAGTFNQCAAAAKQCLGSQPHGIVHHSDLAHLVTGSSLSECEVPGQ